MLAIRGASTSQCHSNSKRDAGTSVSFITNRCNKRCRQVRHRQCRDGAAGGSGKGNGPCAQHVLKQERKCRKGRCRARDDRAFHVVLPPRRDGVKQPATPAPSTPASHQQSDVRVLLSLNSIFYSSWSRWSPCSKSCTTTRYKYAIHCIRVLIDERTLAAGRAASKWCAQTRSCTRRPTATARAPTARSGTAPTPVPPKTKTVSTKRNSKKRAPLSTFHLSTPFRLRQADRDTEHVAERARPAAPLEERHV